MNEKNIVKASLFTLILAFMVSGMFAIAAVMNKEKPVEVEQVVEKTIVYKTYHYLLNTPTGENNPSNWEEGPAPQDCDGDEVLCSISAPEGANGKPDFSGITGNIRDSDIIRDKEFKN